MSPKGAPRGNKNALKHGFYSRKFLDSENEDLDQINEISDLVHEIYLLRILVRRLFTLIEDEPVLKEKIALVYVISDAAAKLSTLIRTQKFITGEGNEATNLLLSLIDDVSKEWRK